MGSESVEPGPAAGAETLPEGLDRGEVDSGSAVGAKAVDGDAVAELLEGEGQGGSGPSLVFVDGEAFRIGVGGGTGGVEEDEDAEVAGKLAAFQVDVFGRGVAGAQVDEEIDERLDVEVVAIGPAAEDLGAEAQPGQASAEHLVVRHGDVRDVRGGAQGKVDDPAVLWPVPVVVYIPLRVESATHAHGRAGRAVRW